MGVRVSVCKTGQLNALGPGAILTEDIITQLKSFKAELLKVLSDTSFDGRAVKEALQFLCHGLEVTPEVLIRCYFSADDLEDIRAGRYPDLVELRKLILSDPEYPFDGRHQQGGHCE